MFQYKFKTQFLTLFQPSIKAHKKVTNLAHLTLGWHSRREHEMSDAALREYGAKDDEGRRRRRAT